MHEAAESEHRSRRLSRLRGDALIGELIAAYERGPWCQMVAVVGDSANLGSIALHRRFGFELVETLSVGFKFGRWVDNPILQRALRAAGQ